jgi:hypothetical protein
MFLESVPVLDGESKKDVADYALYWWIWFFTGTGTNRMHLKVLEGD